MIKNADSLDIAGVRKDGGVDLVMVSKGKWKETPKVQTLLLDKTENYLRYALSKDFQKDFPGVSPDKVWIILKSEEKLPRVIEALCEKIKAWVEENGAHFKVE